MRVGIDFGTTNSAVAVIEPGGTSRMLELVPGERVQRTVIYASPEREISYGNAAFTDYVENDLQGRFLRSLKMFLPADVPNTTVGGKRQSFTELVTNYLTFLAERTEQATGRTIREVVLGRPVRFSHEPEREALASERLARAARDAGLPNVRFQLEPVAAAHTYEQTLSRERVVLVGDFGGGTADFAVLRVGPERIGRDRMDDVLATSGVPRAGDALDGRFLDIFLLEWFGRGATVESKDGRTSLLWDHPLHRQIQQLYYVHLLRDDGLLRRLERVRERVDDKNAVDRLVRLVFDDLGYPMAWAIERTKRALSHATTAEFAFHEFYSKRLDIHTSVDRERFATGCQGMLGDYDRAVTEVLRAAGCADGDIHEVFLTGGTSQLPFLQAVFAERFGSERLRSGDAFTSVAEGLALS